MDGALGTTVISLVLSKCLHWDNIPFTCKDLFQMITRKIGRKTKKLYRLILGWRRAERQGKESYIKYYITFSRAKHFRGLTMLEGKMIQVQKRNKFYKAFKMLFSAKNFLAEMLKRTSRPQNNNEFNYLP